MKITFYGGPSDGYEVEIVEILPEYRIPVPPPSVWNITEDWHYKPIRCQHYEAGRNKHTGKWEYWYAGEW